jgi:hypothetical protein
LLSALAVYPELNFPLTLYLDKELCGEATGREPRLLAVARLPWCRHGRMPEYLRRALVTGLPRNEYRQVRGVYRQLLDSALEGGGARFELEIAARSRWGLGRLLRAVVRSAPADTAIADAIFARVLLGGRPGRLDLELPRLLARRLPFKE